MKIGMFLNLLRDDRIDEAKIDGYSVVGKLKPGVKVTGDEVEVDSKAPSSAPQQEFRTYYVPTKGAISKSSFTTSSARSSKPRFPTTAPRP